MTFQTANKQANEKEYDSQEVKTRIVQSRVRLLLNHPFFGNLATRLIIKDATEWCPTAAVDGKHLYYNKNFLGAMDDQELDFIIAHEVMHCVYDHIDRRGSKDAQYWNMAGDYVINRDLKAHNIGKMPKVGLYDRKYDENYTDEIYNDLYTNQKEKKETLDMHIDKLLEEMEKQDKDGNGSEDGEGNKDGKKGPVKISKEERKQLKDEIKNAVIQAAQVAGAGNVPAGVERLIQELTKPKMDWRTMLDQQITSVIKNDFTFMKPSRKGWHTEAILPGLKNDTTIDICVAIDTSGSISNKMLKDFLSEINGIMSQYTDYKIYIWSFDTEVHNPVLFTPDKDIAEYQPAGFGGTEFMANWDWMKKEGVEPKKLVVFTDGYPFGQWGDENYCDTLWVVHSNHDKNIQAPFGQTCIYDSN
jgi:predicted metal-dependent peptidase